jgi:hypothetical protein
VQVPQTATAPVEPTGPVPGPATEAEEKAAV